MDDGSPDGFKIAREQYGTTVRVLVAGELDIATTPQLHAQLAHEQGNGATAIVLDLSDVTFMDSTGLHALLSACDNDDQRLRIILSAAAARVIDIAALRDRLPIIDG
jgi:anti-anti-sigma factor